MPTTSIQKHVTLLCSHVIWPKRTLQTAFCQPKPKHMCFVGSIFVCSTHTNAQPNDRAIGVRATCAFRLVVSLTLSFALCLSFSTLPDHVSIDIANEMPLSVCVNTYIHETYGKRVWMCVCMYCAIDICCWYSLVLVHACCVYTRLYSELCCVNKIYARFFFFKLIVVFLPTSRASLTVFDKFDAFIYFHMEWYILSPSLAVCVC